MDRDYVEGTGECCTASDGVFFFCRRFFRIDGHCRPLDGSLEQYVRCTG